MARKTETRRETPAKAPTTLLGKARWMLELGDVRRARELAGQAAGAGSEADKEEARALLERLAPDRVILLAAAAVLALILVATWIAILRG